MVMKISELVKKINSTDQGKIQEIFDDEGYEGSCPCFWGSTRIGKYKVKWHGHCWRTCQDCASQGIHIDGKLPLNELWRIARAFKRKLDAQHWYGLYEIVLNGKTYREKP